MDGFVSDIGDVMVIRYSVLCMNDELQFVFVFGKFCWDIGIEFPIIVLGNHNNVFLFLKLFKQASISSTIPQNLELGYF